MLSPQPFTIICTLVNALSVPSVIFILNEGRPRIFNKIEPGAAAVLDVYLPSNFGADALADILTGDVNPNGKLPITYPRYTNSLAPYIHKPSEGEGNPQGGDFFRNILLALAYRTPHFNTIIFLLIKLHLMVMKLQP